MAEQRIINGRIIERLPDGTFVDHGPANQPPADPSFPYEGPKAAADAARAQAQAAQAQAQTPYASSVAAAEARKAEADARTAEANAEAKRQGNVEMTSASRESALKGFQDTRLLDLAIREIELRAQQGPLSTGGLRGLSDYFGTPKNKTFDTAGNSIRALVKGVLKFTGQENNTPLESQLNFGPYIPQSSDWDENILAKIDRLKRLRDSGYERAVQSLGGVPDASGQIVPIPPSEPLNAMTVNRIMGGDDKRPAEFGATEQSKPLPPEMQAEYNQFLGQWAQNPDPEAYVQFRKQLDEKYGFATNEEGNRNWATATSQALQQGGATINPTIPSPTVPLSGLDRARNMAVNNPLGAGLVNYADAVTAGAVGGLAPDQIENISAKYPKSAIAGQIGGAITGTKGLGLLGGNTAGRLAPILLGGGEKAQFARNLATDTAYSGLYGANTGQDPLETALWGTFGSGLGQGTGKFLGGLTGGVPRSTSAQALSDEGVRLTTGRNMGPIASSFEDKMSSLPFVGDMVRRRSTDSFIDYNMAGFRKVGEPIGFNPTNVGREGIEDLRAAKSKAFDDATAGVQIAPDDILDAELTAARGSPTTKLTPEMEAILQSLEDIYITPMRNAGVITGDGYKRAREALVTARGKATGPLQQPMRDRLTGLIDALDNQIVRGGGQETIDKLTRAKAANKGLKILEQAALDAAKVGTQTGERNVFTPAQLLAAARNSEKKYGTTQALQTLGEQGQDVLPSTIPNSGSFDRYILGAGLLGTAGGADYLTDDGDYSNTAKTAALLSLLTAGGTRRGQKALNRLLTERPPSWTNAGKAIDRRAGLFGSAALPFVISP